MVHEVGITHRHPPVRGGFDALESEVAAVILLDGDGAPDALVPLGFWRTALASHSKAKFLLFLTGTYS